MYAWCYSCGALRALPHIHTFGMESGWTCIGVIKNMQFFSFRSEVYLCTAVEIGPTNRYSVFQVKLATWANGPTWITIFFKMNYLICKSVIQIQNTKCHRKLCINNTLLIYSPFHKTLPNPVYKCTGSR